MGPEWYVRMEEGPGVGGQGEHHDPDGESVSQGDQEEVRSARRARRQNRAGADEDQRERADELRDPFPPRGDRHRASPGGVAAPSICSFLFDAADDNRHRMYDAEPRSKPGTNSSASSDGCHAASGNTRFGKNRPVSAEICVATWSAPKSVSRIRCACSRHTRSSMNPTECRYSCKRT